MASPSPLDQEIPSLVAKRLPSSDHLTVVHYDRDKSDALRVATCQTWMVRSRVSATR